MALIIESGAGLTDADSYVSADDVTTYLASYQPQADRDAWAAVASSEQERYCRVATQYVDALFAARWHGLRSNTLQSLEWPRTGVYRQPNFLYPTMYASDVIPTELKQAVSYMAVRAVSDTLMPDLDDTSKLTRNLTKVGPIWTDQWFDPGRPRNKRYQLLEGLLRNFVRPSGSVERA